MPESKSEFVARRPQLQLINVYAFLRVVQGFKDGNVLFETQRQTQGTAVHDRTEEGGRMHCV